ncbi:MAG: translation initiation inhibitor [Kiritimatiellae bacterium]|nr:translation initiation inhibitor [Kiritimatiellia bacterium]
MNQSEINPDLATLKLSSHVEHHVCLLADDDGHLPVINGRLPAGHHKLHQFVFGGCHHYDTSELTQAGDVPTTWLQGDACRKGEMLAMQLLAISGADAAPVFLDGKPIGSVYGDEDARYCYLGGIIPADVTASREEQARSVFERMGEALESIGMKSTDIVRTWLYLDRLLDWYDPFNTVRTTWFNEQGIFDHMVPASTGIGAANPFGAALTAGLIAVQPLSDAAKIEPVASPLQCPALDYSSSFSRAVEIGVHDHRTLYISGTASIDPDGNSVHLGDAEQQVDLTMRVVAAILESRGMSWNDAVRGIAYFKNITQDKPIYDAYCKANNIPNFPLAISHADVCRDDLLFEIEVDAVVVG